MQHNKSLQLVILGGALLSLLIVSTTYSNSVYAQNKFRAKLDAKNEVPPVDSAADGVATFKIKDDAVKSKINATGITDISGAKIFMGKIGQNGDPIVDLLNTGEKEQGVNGVTIKGNFTASDFGGSMEGKSLSDLQSAMASNQTFVNIMTSEHPDGELAGHIYSKGSTIAAEDSETSSAQNEVASKEGNSEDSTDNVPGEDEDQ
jgi:hypothetical protein